MDKETYRAAFEVLRGGLSQKIAAMKADVDRIRQEIEERERHLDDQQRQIAELEGAISAFQGALDIGGPPPSRNGLDTHRYRNQTVRESAFEIMQSKGGTARVTEILRILADAGKLNYTKGYSTVKKTLDRDERFEKVRSGVYRLSGKDSGLQIRPLL